MTAGAGKIGDAFSQFDDNYFNGYKTSYENALDPTLDDQYGIAKDKMTAMLAGNGQLGGSAGNNSMAQLQKSYDDSRTDIANQASDASNNLRSQVQGTENQLYATNAAAADPSLMGQQAQAAAGTIVAPQAAPTLGDVFGGAINSVATATKANQTSMNPVSPVHMVCTDMNPLALGGLLGGTILGGLGGILGKSEAYQNAQNMAAAANASVAKNIGVLNGYEGQDQGTFSNLMAGYDPAMQEAKLKSAQDNRSATNVSNIVAPDAQLQQQPGGSPMSTTDLAKRLTAAHDFSVNRAKSLGTLGGYGDAWLGNQIANSQAGNQIGVTNNLAEARKALVQPEAELASEGAYSPPSIWSSLLGGAGNAMAAYGGKNLITA